MVISRQGHRVTKQLASPAPVWWAGSTQSCHSKYAWSPLFPLSPHLLIWLLFPLSHFLSFQIWPTSFSSFLSWPPTPMNPPEGRRCWRFVNFRGEWEGSPAVRKLKLCAPPSLCQNSGAGCASSQLKNGTLVSIQPLFLMCLSSIKVVIAGQALNMPKFLTPILSVHPSPVKNLPCAPHLTLIQLLFSLMRHSRPTKWRACPVHGSVTRVCWTSAFSEGYVGPPMCKGNHVCQSGFDQDLWQS